MEKLVCSGNSPECLSAQPYTFRFMMNDFSYFAAMMNLETKDAVLMLILGIMIHFLVIVWYKGKHYEDMLFEGHVSRALVLAAQVMLIQNGNQPPPHIRRRGVSPGGKFSRARNDDAIYRDFVRSAFPNETDTAAKGEAFSADLDAMIDDRDFHVHPLNDAMIVAEADRLTDMIGNWVAAGRTLNKSEKLALLVLSKCREN